MIERITKEQYMVALHHFRRSDPMRAWGIDERPQGDAFWLEGTGVYFCIAHISNGNFEINGAFRMSIEDYPLPRDVAAKIVRKCTAIGAKRITLSAFEGAHKAWMGVCFETVSRDAFAIHMAPINWKPEYGMPAVHYMQLETP